ncbi:MAG: TonB-dependent receptor [Tannerellaceae bacterium]|jgi:TonB-linked SusC/RagA family outer membrane protein|nr:TonB-dependent receptor [Tannerellaceae bacterium]
MKQKIIFTLLLSLLTGIQCLIAQQIGITGVVVGQDDGEPLIGASVIIKGTSTGTVTDIDGKFSLNAPANATLVVSYVGMKSQEVAVRANLRIELESDAQTIDEVMVVAYGTAKKSSFTGSATAVGAQMLEKRTLTNVTSALEGHVPGLQVTSGMGQPGSSPTFRIRGFGSINSSSDPLIVLDGAIFDGNFMDINPNDIESMTVLKDAASTSLYGSSAGNGVILVNTKQGKGDVGSHSVNVSVSQGFSERGIPEYDRIDIYQYFPAQWQMMKNMYQYGSAKLDAEAAAQRATNEIYTKLGKYNPFQGIAGTEIVGTDGKLNPAATTLLYGDDLDWEGAHFGTGYFQDYNISYSSKNDKSDAFASFGYQDNEGYAIKTGMKRFTGRVNYNIYPVKWFKSGVNLSATRSQSEVSVADDAGNSSSYNNIFRYARGMAPIYPIHKHDPETGAYVLDGNGEKMYDYDGARLSDAGRDALVESIYNDRLNERDQLSGRAYVEFTLIDGLKVNISGNLETRNLLNKRYENTLVGDGKGVGRLSITHNRYTTYQFNQLLTYQKTFGDHSIDLLAGHENYSYARQYLYGFRQSEIVGGLYEFGNFVNINSLSSFTDTYTKEGYLFRANYNFRDRYYGSFSYRHDGTSRFHKDSRWGDFYSIGASWRLDQEDFLQDISWVNSLKLRASYGETGNDRLLTSTTTERPGSEIYYAYPTLYNVGYSNKDEPGIYFDSFGNPALVWETVVSSDVAVEFGLFERLTGAVEYYNRYSRNLLFTVPTPTSSGVSNLKKNLGRIDNYGIEVTLDYLAFKNKDWNISVGANVSTITNVIKSLPQETPTIVDNTKRYEVGHSRYEFWLRQFVGVHPDTGAALYIFDAENQATGTDVFEYNGQQVTTTLNKAKFGYSGSVIPKLYGGFNFAVGYKGFELSGVFSYQLGGDVLDGNYQSLMNNRYGYAWHVDVLKAWKQPGDITDVPRLDDSQATNFDGQSTRWLVSSDFLNIKSITLSYTLPRSILRPVGFKSTRIALSGENLYHFNARKGLNAAAEFNGLSYNAYLPARTITASLNFSF